MNALVCEFKEFYRELDISKLDALSSVYDDDVMFIDPVGEVSGLRDINRYFHKLCKRLDYCRFRFESEMIDEQAAVFAWVMEYAHPRLAGGRDLQLPGMTRIEYGNKVVLHRDYYDLGAMCYEHLPLVGPLTRTVKSRLAHA